MGNSRRVIKIKYTIIMMMIVMVFGLCRRVLMCIDIRIGTFLRLYLSRSLVTFINEKLVVYIFKNENKVF